MRWLIAALAIGAIVTLLLLERNAGGQSWAILRQVRLGWLALAVIAAVGSWVMTTLGLFLLGRAAKFYLPIHLLLPAYMAGNFCGLVTPFGSGGTPGQAYFISRLGVEFGSAFAVAAARGLISSTIVASAAGIAVLFMPGWLPTGGAGAAARTALIVVVALLCGAALLVVSERPSRWIAGWAIRAKRPLAKRFWGSLAAQTDLFREALRAVGGRKSALVATAACEAVAWVLIIAVAPLVLKSLGWSGAAWVIFFRTLALFLIIPMSPTPGSAGSAEVGFFLVGQGLVRGDVMTAAVVLWRAVLYYLPLLVGGVSFAWIGVGATVKRQS